jgi:hypothetical protein
MSFRLRAAHLAALAAAGAVSLGGLAAASSAPTGPDPAGPAQFGLCNAWLHGEGKGAHHKRNSTAFKRLAAFVAAEHPGVTVTQFCEQVVASHTETSTTSSTAPGSDTDHHGHGTPPSTEGGTGVADAHSDGASEHGTTTANDESHGHTAAGSGNAGSHRP